MSADPALAIAQPMTAEHWKQVEQTLSFAFGSVYLQCDEYKLTLQVVPIKPLQMAIQVYVDGVFRGKWLIEDCEERRRFLRPRRISLYSRAEKERFKAALKGVRKSFLKPHLERMEKVAVIYDSTWSSISSLKRHLIANNKAIALLPESPL